MKIKINNKWFSLIELVISMVILTTILVFLVIYIGDLLINISKSNEKANIEISITEFKNQIYSKSNLYSSSSIIIDQESDVLLFSNIDNSKWVIIWVVDINTMKLDINNDIYWNKKIWFYELSETQLTDILWDNIKANDLIFFNDKLYDFQVKNLEIIQYNTWTLNDSYINIITNYNPWLVWNNWNWINKEDLYKINITF